MKLTDGIFDKVVMVSYAHEPSSQLHVDFWVTENTFTFTATNEDGKKYHVTIPKGYLTDGASVPHVFWNIAPPMGRYLQSTIVHDWLCECLTVQDESGDDIEITRADADEFLRAAMIAHKVCKLHKFLLFVGVRFYSIVEHIKKPSLNSAKRALETLEY